MYIYTYALHILCIYIYIHCCICVTITYNQPSCTKMPCGEYRAGRSHATMVSRDADLTSVVKVEPSSIGLAELGIQTVPSFTARSYLS